ncbi:MAG TPA: hemerythrin domain-containing protein [Candidatus Babeliales bacterium]|nr:hemerythrin domain-containing protein [Candidatus Babeliales bacterium]
MRYKFYREHKYVSFRFDELERLVARTDFRSDEELNTVKQAFEELIELLEAHAHYEDTSLHVLLKQKNSDVYKHIEQDHEHLDEQIISLRTLLTTIDQAGTQEDKIEAGYQFYLWFRKFSGDNLLHLHEEETIILPELQRLYSDEELKKVEAATYNIMTAQDLIQMMQELFPQMNPSDWEAFLIDIKDAVPVKFTEAWNGIKTIMTPEQQLYFIKKLNI